MAKDIVSRLEHMSDLLLVRRESCWVAASLLVWEAAQHIKKLREESQPSEIYVSTAHSPDE